MPSDALLVGIDFGTTNLKAIVFDATGAIVASTSLRTPTHIPRPGWASYDPEEMWQTTVAALRKVVGQLDHPERIVGVAVASIGETGVLLDAHGQPLGEVIAWFDARTKPQAQWLEQHIGRDRLFAATGMSLQPIFSLCKLLWLREHAADTFRRAVRWLNTADYIAYCLCGEQATDYSLGCRTLLMDIRRLQWDPGIFHDVGMDPDLFAPLVPSGTRLGTVTFRRGRADRPAPDRRRGGGRPRPRVRRPRVRRHRSRKFAQLHRHDGRHLPARERAVCEPRVRPAGLQPGRQHGRRLLRIRRPLHLRRVHRVVPRTRSPRAWTTPPSSPRRRGSRWAAWASSSCPTCASPTRRTTTSRRAAPSWA